jgi:hypothetical protein
MQAFEGRSEPKHLPYEEIHEGPDRIEVANVGPHHQP